MKTTVAIVAMGEMGSGVGKRLVERGARVLTSLAGRSGASAERAKWAGAEVVDDDSELVSQSDFIFSIVPNARAGEFAARMLPHIRVAERKPVYVDCNALSPATVRKIGATFEAERLPFVDVSVIGRPPAPDREDPRIYACGDAAKRFAELSKFGLDIRVLSNRLGDASGLKLATSGISKGIQALGAVIMLAGVRNGMSEAVFDELLDGYPEVLKHLASRLPKNYGKAYRWVGEMEEIAQFLEPETGGSEMFRGASHFFTELAADYAKGPNNGRVGMLNEFLTQKELQLHE